MTGLPGYDKWKTTPPDEFTSDDVNGHVVLTVERKRLNDDGELVDAEVCVDVRVRRGEVVEATDEATDELIELTPAEEAEAVERVAMNPEVEED